MCKQVHVALDVREFVRSEELDRRISALNRQSRQKRKDRSQIRSAKSR